MNVASQLDHTDSKLSVPNIFIHGKALLSFRILLLIKQLIVPYLSVVGKRLIVQHLESSKALQSAC